MSITETKFFKERIQTPELITEKGKFGSINVSEEIRTNDVLLDGISINETLFSAEEVNEFGPYLTTELFQTGSGAQNAIRIRMFEINPNDYIGKKFRSVTVYKGTGYDLGKEGSSDFASIENNPDGVWMFVDCIKNVIDEEGQIIEEIVVDRKFSLNRANQTGTKDQETTATWDFTPFELKEQYDVLQFRLTNEYMTPIYPTTGSSHALLLKASNYGGEGWKVLDQDKHIDFTKSNFNKKNQTAKFSFMLETARSGIVIHMDDDDIHVTPALKRDIMYHAGNEEIHVTKEDKENWNSKVDLTTLDEKLSHIDVDFELNAGNHIEITDNNVISLKQEYTSSIDTRFTDIETEVEKINTALNVRENSFTTLREGLFNPDGGKMKVFSFQLSKKHFTSGSIKQIEIPYSTGWDFQPSQPNGNYVNQNIEAYLAVQIFYEGESNDTVKSLSETYFSNNTQTQPKYHTASMKFSFDDLIIPKNYKFIRFMCVSNTTDTPNGITKTNCLPFRVCVLSLDENRSDYTSYDDDDCSTVDVSGNYVVHTKAISVSSVLQILDNLQETSATLDTHIGDGSHINDSQKTNIGLIPTINSNLTELTTKVSDLESTVADNSEVEVINEALFIETGDYYKYSFDTPISPNYQNDKENLATQMIRFGKSHFPTGRITEIELPYDYGKSNLTVHLAVQVVKNGESKNIEKTAAETVYSSNVQSQAYRTKGTSVFKFDNLIIPDDYQYVRLAFVPNTSIVPEYDGYNCTIYGINVVDLVSDSDGCRLLTYGLESKFGAQCRVKYVKSSVIQQIAKDLNSTIHGVDSKVTSHIGDASHLTDAQKSAISQISTISTDFDSHKTNGGTLHVTDDEKSKWTSHVDNDALHVTTEFKTEISDAIDINTVALNSHTNNEDIHFSKTEIEDVLAEIKVRDLTQEGTRNEEVQGIGYAQICAATYGFSEKNYLKSIRIPQNHTRTDYTKDDVYLVIHGDITGNDAWQFVACSSNTQYQEANGEDMVFEFEQGIDLGVYKRCRFFYSLTNEGEIALPTIGSDFNGVKMAFAARVIDTNCWIMQSGGGNVFSRAFPAIISYIVGSPIATINHKDNEDRHVTPELKESISNVATVVNKVQEHDALLEIGHNEYVSYDYNASVPSKDDLPNHTTSQILIKREVFTSGKVEKIEVPYLNGTGLTGYMAVQIIYTGEDSFRVSRTAAQTYYSTNAVTQTSGAEGVATFYFDNLLLPNDYYGVRISFVSDKTIVPQYEGTDCLSWGIKIVSSGGAHYNMLYIFRAGSSYLYSSYDYTILLSASTITSSLDYIVSSGTGMTSEVKTHIGDSDIHVTAEEKEKIANSATKEELNTAISNIPDRFSITKYMRFSAFDNPNYEVNSGGMSNATGIQLSRNHFVSGDVKTVEIHHLNGSSTSNIYLCAIIYDADEDENTVKTLDDCIFSSKPISQGGSSGIMTFIFDNLILPEDYKFVKFLFAKSKDVFPVHTDTETVHNPRIQVLRNKAAGNFNEYADDECKIYTTSGWQNWYAAVEAGYLVYQNNELSSMLERIIALEERVSELENS